MEISRIKTLSFNGVEATEIDVQVSLVGGMPSFTIVGLADKAVTESRERVRNAFAAIGLGLPMKRITVNLAPADIQKEGSHYDLPIALGLLVAMGVIPQSFLDFAYVLGELSLDGSVAPVAGILPAAIEAVAQEYSIVCPYDNGSEATWAGDELDILAPKTILDLLRHYKGEKVLSPPRKAESDTHTLYPDFKDVIGQESAKRVMEIAAAGGHHVLMVGPPGAGKSMLAARLPGIMPELSREEMLDVSIIASLAGMLRHGVLSQIRPYRDPHHNCSMPAMVGGGAKAKPGEVTLAHHGILFLDELPEFSPKVLESLRQPIENRSITVSRVNAHTTYPANFQLIAAMNPCKCGHFADASLACSKAPRCGTEYQSRLSGPLLDRFDIHIEVPAIKPFQDVCTVPLETSAIIKRRVIQARNRQKEYFLKEKQTYTLNAKMDSAYIETKINVQPEAKELLRKGVETFQLSMRGYHRVLRVAKTIADLAGSDQLQQSHIAEALSYRQLSYATAVKRQFAHE